MDFQSLEKEDGLKVFPAKAECGFCRFIPLSLFLQPLPSDHSTDLKQNRRQGLVELFWTAQSYVCLVDLSKEIKIQTHIVH